MSKKDKAVDQLALVKAKHAQIGGELISAAIKQKDEERAKIAYRYVAAKVNEKEQYERIKTNAEHKIAMLTRILAAINAGDFNFNAITGEIFFNEAELETNK